MLSPWRQSRLPVRGEQSQTSASAYPRVQPGDDGRGGAPTDQRDSGLIHHDLLPAQVPSLALTDLAVGREGLKSPMADDLMEPLEPLQKLLSCLF